MLRIEPEWWARCRELVAQGLTYAEAGSRLGKSRSAVAYCLRPQIRERAIAKGCEQYRKAKAAGTQRRQFPDTKRQFIRKIARREFLESGSSNPEDLRSIYKRLECL